jgi:uncharacterized protein YbjT (DUF2867 family)
MGKYLIIGASGTVGSRIVEQLAREGHSVRATTHRRNAVENRKGIERVYLDVATGEGIKQAFEGVSRAFLLSPPGYADQQKVLSPLIAEAKRRNLEKVVLMTAMGANAADTPLHRAEQELKATGLRYNVVRPNWFMQNFNTFWLAGIRDEGRIALPVGTAKTSFIDARDIAAVAARLLTTDDQDNRDFDITGPVALDHDAVAHILSEATGRKVAFEDIEPGMLRKGLLAGGVPADYAEFLLVILGFLKQGYAKRTTGLVRQLLGREPIAFEQYAREHRGLYARAA